EDLAVCILREEGQDAGLATTSLWQVMKFDERMFGIVGHAVKVEVDGFPLKDRLPGQCVVPSGQQFRDLLWSDARGVFGEEAPLGHGVEAAEEPQSLVGDERHDVLLRSIDHSLSASEALSACSAGIMREPGRFAFTANASVSRRTRSGMNRNRPPTLVVNSLGLRENSRTSATASLVGPTAARRSSSSRRGKAAKPSSRRIARTAVAPRGVPSSLSTRLMS